MAVIRKRKKLFFAFTLLLLFVLFELIGGTLIKWQSSFDYEGINNYSNIRQMLLGTQASTLLPRFTGHANLNYTQTPGFIEFDREQVNTQGFRGDTLPLAKPDNTLRILFLGGSTTFGMSLGDYRQAFPHLVGQMLQKTDVLSNNKTKVEIINAGLMWGTSFELLSHYKYRYSYFKPDIVIIHTGGNDSQAYDNIKAYQPDYSHWRKNMENIKPLTGLGHLLMKSKFVSFIVISLFYNNTGENMFVHFKGKSAMPLFADNTFTSIPDSNYNVFYKNMNDLLTDLKTDSASVFIMPFVFNPNFDLSTISNNYYEGVETHNAMLKHLAQKHKTNWVDISNTDFIDDMWIDDCHLYDAGHVIKARSIFEAVKSNLFKTEQRDSIQ